MLKNMGALGYKASQISLIMGFDTQLIENELADESSEFYKLYEGGKQYSEYLIDVKLMEMAHSGDIKAIGKLELRRRIRNEE